MPLTRRRFLRTCSAAGASAALLPKNFAAAANASGGSAVSGPVSLTPDDLAAAEKIAGIEFTAAQRAPLVKQVTGRAAEYARLRGHMRASPIGNDVPPAIGFDPRLAGIYPPSPAGAQREPAWQPPAFTRPGSDEDLAFCSVAQLAALLRSGQVSSRELTELALARLQKHDSVLHAVVTLTEERARRQADAADAELKAGKWRGPLHGIPWGAKDLLAVRGYPTTWGAAPFQDQRIDVDAAVVRRLDAAGAVLVAKLTLGALANNDGWFGGQTKSPWNIANGSSGSSAGSCAAVSAGLVPFAIGSETLGSIVSPSTRNAVTGFRPSFGRISRDGAMALSWSMDKLGPIARTAEDCALVFSALHGFDAADASTVDAPFAWKPGADLGGHKIGYLVPGFNTPGEWHASNQAVLATLRQLGAELVPLQLPNAPVQALRIILNVEAAAAFDDLTLTGAIDDLLAPGRSNWSATMRAARYIPAVEYVQANRVRTQLIRDLERALSDAGVDVWLAPPGGNNLVITNLTGHPAVCVPIGFAPVKDQPADSPRRLTAGMTFNARLYQDDAALACAHAFQRATDWHLRRPPIA